MKKIMMILVMAAGLLAQKSQAITAVEFQSLYKANKNAQITRFQFSSSEQTVVTGFSNGAITIGNIKGSNQRSYFFGQSISALALSRDESKLAVSYSNGTQVIDLSLNKTLVQFNVESEILQFSPDSKSFAYADSKSELKVMDLSLQTTKPIQFDGELLSVSFAENGQSLIIGTTDSKAKVYRFTDGKEFIVDIGNNEMASHAELSSDARFAYISGQSTFAQLDLTTGAVKTTLGHAQTIDVNYSSTSNRLFRLNDNKTLEVIDLKTAQKIQIKTLGLGEEILLSRNGDVCFLHTWRYDPTTKKLDKYVEVIDVKNQTATLLPSQFYFNDVQTLNEPLAVLTLLQGEIQKVTLKSLNQNSVNLNGAIQSFDVSPSHQQLVVATRDKLNVLDVNSLRVLKVLPASSRQDLVKYATTDDKIIVNRGMAVLDLATEIVSNIKNVTTDKIENVKISPNGLLGAYSTNETSDIYIIDMVTQSATTISNDFCSTDFAFSADSQYLIIGGSGDPMACPSPLMNVKNKIRIFDLKQNASQEILLKDQVDSVTPGNSPGVFYYSTNGQDYVYNFSSHTAVTLSAYAPGIFKQASDTLFSSKDNYIYTSCMNPMPLASNSYCGSIFNTKTAQSILVGHGSTILARGFTSDEQSIVTASADYILVTNLSLSSQLMIPQKSSTESLVVTKDKKILVGNGNTLTAIDLK